MDNYNEEITKDRFYRDLSKSLVEEIFRTSFNGVPERTQLIEVEHSNLIKKIDELNIFSPDKDKFQQDYQKCQDYYEKAKNLKKQLLILNENCTSLKRRVFQLKEVNDTTRRKNSILEQAEPTVVAPTVYKMIKKTKPREIAAEIPDKDK